MTKSELDFLKILKNTVHPEENITLDAPDWDVIVSVARKQNLFPLVYDAAGTLPGFETVEDKYFIPATGAMSGQMQNTSDFVDVYKHFLLVGLAPIVMKVLKKADLLDDFPSDYHKERICFHNGQKNYFLSVFYHIWNAFAHCRLNMIDDDGECVLILEDGIPQKDKTKVSARMILRKSTLLKWIDIIEGGEREWTPSK
ncbi:MAG: hypothetical protein LUG99_09325 [Lachnospiraceae bacterium]|nr:hypothetical protein [Lachnospiraceae bacterium]